MAIAPERDVKLLIEKHRAGLDELKSKLQPQHDDIYLIRFMLSAEGDAVKAEAAVKATLKWRAEKADLLKAAAADALPSPKYASFAKFVATEIHGTTTDGDILYIVRAGLGNPKAVFHEMSMEEVMDFMFYRRERVAIRCDEATRRTGRLCKMVNINDLSFASVSKTHRQFSQALTTVTKLSETYYPNLMDTVVMINLPVVMKTVMRTMWGFMPKKTQEKLRVCPGRTLYDDISKCPFARARLSVDELPTFLGGRCQCKGGCVKGTANDQKESNQEVDGDGLAKWTVPAKGKYEVFMTVEPGSTVSYAFQVDKGTLSSGAIAAEAVLRSDGKDLTLLEAQKYRPDQGIIRGDLVCPTAGTVVFTFSNDATMWGRNIRYSVGVCQE